MGTSQFAFATMRPGKWALSDSLARVPASGVPTGKFWSAISTLNEEAGSSGKTKVK